MSTGAIVAIVIAALIVLALVAIVIPRMRARGEERRLQARREEVAGRHRAQAEDRQLRAEHSEHQATIAEAEAQKARAEAELHESRAQLHERGLADDRLDEDNAEPRFDRQPGVADDRVGRPGSRGADGAVPLRRHPGTFFMYAPEDPTRTRGGLAPGQARSHAGADRRRLAHRASDDG
jgi:hypothetical protein